MKENAEDLRDQTGGVRSHRELIVWQKAMDMAVLVFEICKKLPSTEIYGLTAQLKRAASSVPANIAEGNARGTAKDYANFLTIAKGSLMETETFLSLSVRLKYVSPEDIWPVLNLVVEISKMLTSMRKKLNGM